MLKISKPHLVDLLRIFDQKKWIHPRIRYASVRSKGELIKDLKFHVKPFVWQDRIVFVPRRKRELADLPKIEYDMKVRGFLLDDVPQDFPRASRERPRFAVRKGPVTLTFEGWSGPPATQTEPVFSSESQELGTRDPLDY